MEKMKQASNYINEKKREAENIMYPRYILQQFHYNSKKDVSSLLKRQFGWYILLRLTQQMKLKNDRRYIKEGPVLLQVGKKKGTLIVLRDFQTHFIVL